MAYTTALPTQPMRPAQAKARWYLVGRPVTCTNGYPWAAHSDIGGTVSALSEGPLSARRTAQQATKSSLQYASVLRWLSAAAAHPNPNPPLPCTWRGRFMRSLNSSALAFSAASSCERAPVLPEMVLVPVLSALLAPLQLRTSRAAFCSAGCTPRASQGTLLSGTVSCRGSTMVARRSI